MRRISSTLILLGVLATGCDRGSHPRNIATPAPQFVVSDGANSADLSKLRGHIVLLNFWATNCAPCIEELPSLLALQRQMPNLEIVAVSSDEDPAAYQYFLTRHNINLLTIREPDQKTAKLYGTVQIPETYVIDRNGVLRRKFVSAQDWTSPEIMGFLSKL